MLGILLEKLGRNLIVLMHRLSSIVATCHSLARKTLLVVTTKLNVNHVISPMSMFVSNPKQPPPQPSDMMSPGQADTKKPQPCGSMHGRGLSRQKTQLVASRRSSTDSHEEPKAHGNLTDTPAPVNDETHFV